MQLLKTKSSMRFLAMVVLVLLAFGSAGCRIARPLVLPVVGSQGQVNGQWDDLDLYLIDPAGNAPAQRLTDTPELMETDPDLNRDRTRLVYVVRAVTGGTPLLENDAAGNGAELKIATLDGNTNRRLYRSDTMLFTPVWSHDGKQVAFVEMDGDGRLEVKLINADGSGLQTLGYGCSPSWRKDDLALFYSAMDRPDGREGELRLRGLSDGVIHELGLSGTSHTNLRNGVSVAFVSTPYSRRNESVWLLDANGRRLRLTDPGPGEHDLQPVFFGSTGELVFTRHNDADGTYQLMRIHRNTQDRVATPVDQPTPVCFTRGGLWVARHYPR